MSILSWLAERKLERAATEGHFDEFPGKGKPLPSEQWPDPHEGEWGLAFRLLRQANMAPRWIELDKDLRQRVERLRTWLRRQSLSGVEEAFGPQLRARLSRELLAINADIELRNQLAPAAVRPMFPLRADQELAAAEQASSKE